MPKPKELAIANDLPLIPSLDEVKDWGSRLNRPLVQEPLVAWAAEEWKKRFPDTECVSLWSDNDCFNRLALQRVKSGRSLGDNTQYVGFEPIPCPLAVPANWRKHLRGRGIVLTASSGAMLFHFMKDRKAFSVLMVCIVFVDSNNGVHTTPIALCPPSALDTLNRFEKVCSSAAHKVELLPEIKVVGGVEGSFEARVNWDDVILSDALKHEIKQEMDIFFDKGIALYQELNLPPFRKLLFVGPPGTGKSTLCSALAKLAIQSKRLVIYVSASDEDGASFGKIHFALQTAAASKLPTLLLIEELDVYLRAHDKSQILNVLDGMEAPNNPRGVLMVSTTNYPEVIDERIAKRPGRVDRIFYIPPIEDVDQARKMLHRYMGVTWQEEYAAILPRLVGKTGAFVREVSLFARMIALNNSQTSVPLSLLEQSIERLDTQLDKRISAQ